MPIDCLPIQNMNETNKAPCLFQAKVLASPAIVATIVAAEQSITLTGAAVGDIVVTVNKPTQQTVGLNNGRISAANVLKMAFTNPTAAGVTPTAAEVYDVVLLRPAF